MTEEGIECEAVRLLDGLVGEDGSLEALVTEMDADNESDLRDAGVRRSYGSLSGIAIPRQPAPSTPARAQMPTSGRAVRH